MVLSYIYLLVRLRTRVYVWAQKQVLYCWARFQLWAFINIVNILQSLMPETKKKKKKSQTGYDGTILYLVLERLSKEDCSKFKANPCYRERDLCQNNNYQESQIKCGGQRTYEGTEGWLSVVKAVTAQVWGPELRSSAHTHKSAGPGQLSACNPSSWETDGLPRSSWQLH